MKRTLLARKGGDIVRQVEKGRLRPFRGQSGFSLIEVLVAVGILAVIGVTFIAAMYTAHGSVGLLHEQSQAEALARSQLEYIKNSPYDESGEYPVTVDLPYQYGMSINVGTPTCVEVVSDNCSTVEEIVGDNVTTVQEITVTVFRTGGEGDRPVFSVACYKSKVE